MLYDFPSELCVNLRTQTQSRRRVQRRLNVQFKYMHYMYFHGPPQSGRVRLGAQYVLLQSCLLSTLFEHSLLHLNSTYMYHLL
jgi:hypothetical protein